MVEDIHRDHQSPSHQVGRTHRQTLSLSISLKVSGLSSFKLTKFPRQEEQEETEHRQPIDHRGYHTIREANSGEQTHPGEDHTKIGRRHLEHRLVCLSGSTPEEPFLDEV